MSIDPRQRDLWLYELGLNGFVIFRNFLPIDLLEGMKEQLRPMLDSETARQDAGDRTGLRGMKRMSFDIQWYIDKLKGPLDDDRFRRNSVVEELVDAVLGTWRYGVTKVECPLKGSDFMNWHPDVPSETAVDPALAVRPTRLTFNVPLVDINDSNGPMEIIPGSHRLRHDGAEKFIYSIPQLHSVKILMRRGDGLLRNGNLLHRGTPNLTDEPRILLDQTYRSVD